MAPACCSARRARRGAEDLSQCKVAQGLIAKDPAGARTALKACIAKGRLSPRNEVSAQLNLANVAGVLGKWSEVVAAFDAADAAANKTGKPIQHSPAALYLRGTALASIGELVRARGALDQAVRGAPNNYAYLAQRMLVLIGLGERDGALADGAGLAASGQPQWVYEGRVNRSALLFAAKRYQEALAEADKAVAVNASGPQGHNNRCMAAAALSRADAVASCQKAIALAPKTPSFWNSLGFAYEQAGKLKDAEAQYAKVAAAQPKNKDNAAALARVRAKLAAP